MRTLTNFVGTMLVMLLTLSVLGCKKEDLPEYPSKLTVGVELPGSSRAEEQRFITYAPDGTTPVSMRVEYRNGNTAHAKYHPNGKVSEWDEYYPAAIPDGKRQLRLHATLSPKEHYLTDELYREDGSLARKGREVNREYYDASWFFDDGATVSRHKQIRLDAQRTVYLDEKFRPAGTMISQMRLMTDGKLVTTNFAETGVATSRWTQSKVYRWMALYEQFYPDGVTVRIKAEYQPNTAYVEYLKPDGVVEQIRMHEKMFNTLNVVIFAAKDKMDYRQVWRFTNGTDGKLLRQIYDIRNGNVRTIRLQPDGKTPATIEFENVTKTFRKDGTLEKEENRTTGVTRNFKAADNIREHLPERYFIDPPHDGLASEPPKLD